MWLVNVSRGAQTQIRKQTVQHLEMRRTSFQVLSKGIVHQKLVANFFGRPRILLLYIFHPPLNSLPVKKHSGPVNTIIGWRKLILKGKMLLNLERITNLINWNETEIAHRFADFIYSSFLKPLTTNHLELRQIQLHL